MPDEEAFIQELDSVSDIHNMSVDDGWAEPDTGSSREVANLIMIDCPADLQARYGVGPREQADIYEITIVLIFYYVAVELGTNRIAGPVFRNVVKTQSAGWNGAREGESNRLCRQQPSIVGKLHDQRSIGGGLKPATVMEGSVVISDPRLIPTERHS